MVEERLVGNVREPAGNYDLLSVIMLYLGGPEDRNYGGVLKLLDVLLSNETAAAQKRQILQEDFDIPMTQTLESEVSVMCNLSKGVWEKGATDSLLSSIRNLMETMKLTVEQAMDALKIPEADRQKYIELLGK